MGRLKQVVEIVTASRIISAEQEGLRDMHVPSSGYRKSQAGVDRVDLGPETDREVGFRVAESQNTGRFPSK